MHLGEHKKKKSHTKSELLNRGNYYTLEFHFNTFQIVWFAEKWLLLFVISMIFDWQMIQEAK